MRKTKLPVKATTFKNLQEVSENNYVSIEKFEATDTKPFKFGICVEVVDLAKACGEKGIMICVQAAKLPKYLSLKQRESVASCMGLPVKDITVTDVCSYGLNASFDSFMVKTEDEVKVKLAEIDQKIPAYGGLCGFYFDKVLNRLGNTGWQFINGNI